MAVYLNPDRLRIEIATRGGDPMLLAHVAGVSEATLSHAMHGRKVSTATLRALALAMVTLPVLRGTPDLIVSGEPTEASIAVISGTRDHHRDSAWRSAVRWRSRSQYTGSASWVQRNDDRAHWPPRRVSSVVDTSGFLAATVDGVPDS